MTTNDFFGWFFLGVLIITMFIEPIKKAGARLIKYWNRKPDTVVVYEPSGQKWRALPGNILELGDTGFQICFKPDPQRHQFAAYDPEGLCRASSEYLQPLKNICENMAADRAEFRCEVEGWKP